MSENAANRWKTPRVEAMTRTENFLRLMIIVVFAFLLSAQCVAFGEDASDAAVVKGQFKYKHAESTGQNQWIYVDGKLVPIQFDRQKSDAKALAAISALLPEVLGPNSDGKITLIGWFLRRKILLPAGPQFADPPGSFCYSFVLTHWYLETPFNRMEVQNLDHIPQEFRSVRCESLSAKDFSSCNGFDPRQFEKVSAAHHPKTH
jgi:hypothetical protein